MGLVNAIGATLPGASRQRCRTHYARARSSQVPKSAQPWVATLLRTVFEQPDTDAVQAQMRHVLDALETKFPKAAAPSAISIAAVLPGRRLFPDRKIDPAQSSASEPARPDSTDAPRRK